MVFQGTQTQPLGSENGGLTVDRFNRMGWGVVLCCEVGGKTKKKKKKEEEGGGENRAEGRGRWVSPLNEYDEQMSTPG